MSEGEVMVRSYHITILKSRILRIQKARGDVAVTNKRIIYQGKGKRSTFINDVPIENVTSVCTYAGSGFKLGFILIGIMSLILSFTLFLSLNVILMIIGLIAAAIFFFLSFNRCYSLSIQSSGVSGPGIAVGDSNVTVVERRSGFLAAIYGFFFATSGQGAALSVNANPTPEAISMMNELGAIVLDLKTMGDRAVQKWQSYQSASVNISEMDLRIGDAVSGIKSTPPPPPPPPPPLPAGSNDGGFFG
jgi:hypothetical protein